MSALVTDPSTHATWSPSAAILAELMDAEHDRLSDAIQRGR